MSDAGVRVLRIAVLAAVIALSSIAQVYAQTDKGSLEVGIEAGPFLFIATGGHESVGGFGLCVEPHVNYFLVAELAVGVTGFFHRSIEGNESRLFFGAVYGHINYFLISSSRFSPYVGARIGVFNPNSGSLFGIGFQLGLKYFVARQFSINGQLDGAAHPGSGGTLFLSSVGLGLSYHIK